MKIAVINEISAADKNADILKALEGRGHEILNLGNTSRQRHARPALHPHRIDVRSAAESQSVDFVVGGCGTGLGYLNSVMQYPGVVCGHLLTPLDAFLFARINAGNCVSLALNQGYGWAGDVNLRLMFDALFTPETGSGYPPHRAEPQRQGRELLAQISQVNHRSMAEILLSLPRGGCQTGAHLPGLPSGFGTSRGGRCRHSVCFGADSIELSIKYGRKMNMAETTGKLRTRTKVFYGIGDLGNAVVNSAIQFFLMKFYTDAALILPALAGNALLIGKIWDAINDPLFGWITDKTKSRFGKRRVFMIFGAIPLAISIALLWFVPHAGPDLDLCLDRGHLHLVRHPLDADQRALLCPDLRTDRRLR